MSFAPTDYEAIPEGSPPYAGAVQARDVAERLERQWRALHRAALVIAELAGAGEHGRALLHPAEGLVLPRPDEQPLFEDGLGDIIAIVGPGLTALLAIERCGGNAQAAAQALWSEFCAARDGLMLLAKAGSARDDHAEN